MIRCIHLTVAMPKQMDVDIGESLVRWQAPEPLLRKIVPHDVLWQAADAIARKNQPPDFVETR